MPANLLQAVQPHMEFAGVAQPPRADDRQGNDVRLCTNLGNNYSHGQMHAAGSQTLSDKTSKPSKQSTESENTKQETVDRALGLTAPVSEKKSCGETKRIKDEETRANEIIKEIDSKGLVPHDLVVEILPETKSLAMSKNGCRAIQKIIQFAGGSDRADVVKQLRGSFEELYKCPNGNYVLMKIIEVLPPAQLGFLVTELSGKAVAIAKHQFGCRVLERLIEHFPAEQIEKLIAEVLLEAEPLCRHPYGNFVIQHLFEHGSEECKAAVAHQIQPFFPKLATHRAASHVVQSALKYCKGEVQSKLVAALLKAEGEHCLVEVASSRYGSFVVRELAGIKAHQEAVRNVLQEAFPKLMKPENEKHAKRPLVAFGLLQSGEGNVAGFGLHQACEGNVAEGK
jgi:hypothetical protein